MSRPRPARSLPPPDLVEFIERQYRRVERTVFLLVGDRQAAPELTQEVFVRVCRDWEQVRRLEAPGAWTNRVAVNLSRSWLRRQGSERRALARADGRGGRLTVADPAASIEVDERERIRRAVHELPLDERAVVVLRYVADQSVAEVAQALRIPPGTVKTRARRGLAALRAAGLTFDEPPDRGNGEVERDRGQHGRAVATPAGRPAADDPPDQRGPDEHGPGADGPGTASGGEASAPAGASSEEGHHG